MNTTTNLTAEQVYEIAWDYAIEKTAFDKDTHYGCGASFVTIKWGKFCREMKKLGKVRKDGYYGWILEIDNPKSGTLEREDFNQIFSRRLNELDETARAFTHTYLT